MSIADRNRIEDLERRVADLERRLQETALPALDPAYDSIQKVAAQGRATAARVTMKAGDRRG